MSLKSYRHQEDDSEYLVFAGDRSDLRGMTYSRSQAPIRRKLEHELCNRYQVGSGGRSGGGGGFDSAGGKSSSTAASTSGGKNYSAQIFPSGMTAITGTLSAIVDEKLMACISSNGTRTTTTAGGHHNSYPPQPMTIVHGDELYCDVFRTVRRLVAMHCGRVNAEGVSIRDHKQIIKVFQDAAKGGAPVAIFHFEACTNPSSEVFDFSILPELRKLSPNCVFICDNTWLSGWQLNPLLLGADVVVESMTKYVSAGTCIGGFAVVPENLTDALRSWVATYGIFVGDDHCKMFLAGLYTLDQRMEGHALRITELARFLEVDCAAAVGRVLHPTRPSHPSRKLAAQYGEQMGQADTLCPGVMYAHILASKNQVTKVCQGLQDGSILELKTSFGGSGTRIDPWAIMKGNSTKYDLVGLSSSSSSGGSEGTWIRIAVGCADEIEEVKSAFASFLQRATGKPIAGVATASTAAGLGGVDGSKSNCTKAAIVKQPATAGGGSAEEVGSRKEKKKKASRLQ